MSSMRNGIVGTEPPSPADDLQQGFGVLLYQSESRAYLLTVAFNTETLLCCVVEI